MARKSDVDPAVRAAARMLGERGGKARKDALSPERREEIAREGGKARGKALSAKKLTDLARRAARARWDRPRGNTGS